ncbi:hypothetical protein PRIC2_000483 [Phytophthora ramorum]
MHVSLLGILTIGYLTLGLRFKDEEWVAHITRHHLEQDAAELKLLLSDTQAFLARSPPPKKRVQLSSTEEDFTLQPSSSSSIDFKKTYTTVSRIYGTLKGLVEQIHEQLEQKPPLTREEALARIQSMWKIRRARKQLKALVRDVYASFEDPTTGQTYYYNKYTQETQWTKPVALGNEALADSTVNKKKKIKVLFASREEEERQAASKLQAMARSHFARRHMRKLISSVYEKIWDAHTQRFYYHNTRTKEVKWEKPRWVSDEDLLTPRTRFKLQKDVEERPEQKRQTVNERSEPLTSEEAACMLQRAYRRKAGFRNLLRMSRAVYERIYDPEQGLYYYHNTRTKETTWEKPLLLRGAESDVFTPRTRQKKLQSLMNGTASREPRQWTEEEAATRLQGLYRAKKAKEELGARLVQRFKQAVDPSSGQVYYVNLLTQDVSWDPPALVLRSGVQIETFEE